MEWLEMNQKSRLSLFWRIVLTLALVLFYNQILSIIPFPVLGKMFDRYLYNIARINFYPNMFGITPFIFACYLVTLIYYFLGGSGSRHAWFLKRSSMWKILLGVTLLLSLFSGAHTLSWIYSRGSDFQKINFVIVLIDVLFVPVFVFLGIIVVYLITRLGVVDGIWALVVLKIRTWTWIWERLTEMFGSLSQKYPDPNSRLGAILTVLFIVAVVVILAVRYIKRRHFEFSLRTKSGTIVHIPIYVAGLFFFLIGKTIAGFVLPFLFMFILYRPTLVVFKTLDVYSFINQFIPPFIGYFLFIYSAKWIFKWVSLMGNPVLSAEDEGIIRRAFVRWGSIYFIGYFICIVGGFARIRFFGIFDSYFWEILILILIFILQWRNQKQILSGDYTPIFQTDNVRDLLEGQVALVDAGIKVVPHQNSYSFFAGFTVPFLGDKTLYVPETDAPHAELILEDVFKEKKLIGDNFH